MERSILKFDKEVISENEIQEHINWYLEMVKQGYSLLEQKQNFKARELLRKINKVLSAEAKYYERKSVEEKILFTDTLENRYCEGILNASRHQIRTNSYDMLHSNFYDIQDYISSIND